MKRAVATMKRAVAVRESSARRSGELRCRQMETWDAAIFRRGDIVGDIIRTVGAEGRCLVEDS
jgi:hypothetical protein